MTEPSVTKWGVRLEGVEEYPDGRVCIGTDENDTPIVFEGWAAALRRGIDVSQEAVADAIASGEWREVPSPAPPRRYLERSTGDGILCLLEDGDAVFFLNWKDAVGEHWLAECTEPWSEDVEPELRRDWDEMRRRLGVDIDWDALTWDDIARMQRKVTRAKYSRSEPWIVRGAISAAASVIARETGGTIETAELLFFRHPTVSFSGRSFDVDAAVIGWVYKSNKQPSIRAGWEYWRPDEYEGWVVHESPMDAPLIDAFNDPQRSSGKPSEAKSDQGRPEKGRRDP